MMACGSSGERMRARDGVEGAYLSCARTIRMHTIRMRATCPGRRRRERESAAYDGMW